MIFFNTTFFSLATPSGRYILYVEKTEKNPRQLVMRTLQLYLRVKVNNLLSLAVGIWKLCLVKAQLQKNTAKYSKVAGAQLLLLWMKQKNNKRRNMWLHRWDFSLHKNDLKNAAETQNMWSRKEGKSVLIISVQPAPPICITATSLFWNAWFRFAK